MVVVKVCVWLYVPLAINQFSKPRKKTLRVLAEGQVHGHFKFKCQGQGRSHGQGQNLGKCHVQGHVRGRGQGQCLCVWLYVPLASPDDRLLTAPLAPSTGLIR